MKASLIQLNDLPDEILMYIFKKLYSSDVLYSITGVNQRLNRIIHDPKFTNDLCLLRYYPDKDSTFPLPDPMVDRFCLTILPDIGQQIKSFHLEAASMERILRATSYPNLNNLALYNMSGVIAASLFNDENPLVHILKNQISSILIKLDKRKLLSTRTSYFKCIFTKIVTLFTNLQCLKMDLYLCNIDNLCYYQSVPTVISSILLELHVNVSLISDFLYLLDGRFNQLRALYVSFDILPHMNAMSDYNEKPLPTLRVFSFQCRQMTEAYHDTFLVTLYRMINLQELDFSMIVVCDKDFIDGNALKKDILNHMSQLYKFAFNICSLVYHEDQTSFPSNEYLQKTFEYFRGDQIFTSVDHFEKLGHSQCRIYSHPYKLNFYNDITNNFPGGIFNSVTEVSLYDERPFEYEFFLLIAQSFLFMKELTINNGKAQNNKHLTKSNNNLQALSMIEYPKLDELNLWECHDDYVELFLFNTKVSLPYGVRLRIKHPSLERVTYNFTRNVARSNRDKITCIYLYRSGEVAERIKNYFPNLDR